MCSSDLAGDDAVPVIVRQFPALRRLRLARTGITGDGLVALASLASLRDLDLSECSQLDDEALASLVADGLAVVRRGRASLP